jgi:hypothetical protein
VTNVGLGGGVGHWKDGVLEEYSGHVHNIYTHILVPELRCETNRECSYSISDSTIVNNSSGKIDQSSAFHGQSYQIEGLAFHGQVKGNPVPGAPKYSPNISSNRCK